jgi:hypothetical protein
MAVALGGRMIRFGSLLVIAAIAAGCTNSPSTAAVTGTLLNKKSDVPPAPPNNPFDDTLDSVDGVQLTLYGGGAVTKATLGFAPSQQFELDGLVPDDYFLQIDVIHNEPIGDPESFGEASVQFTADGQPLDLGEIHLVYQPEY